MTHAEHDESNFDPVLVATEEQIDLVTFAERARNAVDDMADSFEPDETRTEAEWIEELTTVIHNS